MQAVEQSAVDKISRPDHGSGPDEETTSQASETVTSAKSRDTEEDLESPAKILLVEQTLSQESLRSVQGATSICSL